MSDTPGRDAFAIELRKWWSFDDGQMHTHSWHDRENFIERKLPELLDRLAANPSSPAALLVACDTFVAACEKSYPQIPLDKLAAFSGAVEDFRQGVGEMSDEMVNAACRELWKDLYAQHGGPWDSRGKDEVCVVQLKATMRAALKAASTTGEPKQ